MRVAYTDRALDEVDLAGTWYEQLAGWLDDAVAAGLPEP
ncbi:MAG TPA: pyridoxamine 5'-phosphate oxidase, partial [Pseudonocardiaceae bacterium]|nr:pyridoxamine 5'-phosphate oxidase [Pseudonocardiaceae bacterium]